MVHIINGEIFEDSEVPSTYVTPEVLINEVRQKRNMLLQLTDMPSDHPDFTEDMRTYRQALRDIPKQSGFPYSIDWPTKPE